MGRFDPAGVAAYVRGCRGVMTEFGLLKEDKESEGMGHGKHGGHGEEPLIVEDDRLSAGHMQVNHSVPSEGFFEPSVTVAQKVAVNDLLGTACDPLGGRVEIIRARYSGIVIVLHTFPRIEAGVSVAVVMETAKDVSALAPAP